MGRYKFGSQNDHNIEDPSDITWDQQSHPDENKTIQAGQAVDLNDLIKRFGVKDGSVLPANLLGAVNPEHYGDFTDMPTDLHDAYQRREHLDETFALLPAKVRARFNNNALNMAMFLQDEKNWDEAVSLGLLTKRPQTGSQEPPEAKGGSPPNPPTV